MEETQNKVEIPEGSAEAQEQAIAPPTEQGNPTLEKLKLLGIIIVIFAFALYATQSWKGDAGFPGSPLYDFPFHAYRMWFAADHLQNLNFNFDWDYKSNTLFARTYPLLPYLVGAPFVMLGGLWQGISWYVLFNYFLLGIGMYFLGKTLKLSTLISLFMSLTMLLSYALVLEVSYAGALHRSFAYALLPWLIICFLKIENLKAKMGAAILLGAVFITHALTAISFIIISAALLAPDLIQNFTKKDLKKYFQLVIIVVIATLLALPYLGTIIIEQSNDAIKKPLYITGTSKELFGYGAAVPEAFVERKFGAHGTSLGDFWVYGYLGISLMLLAIIGAINKLKLAIPFLLLIIFFYAMLSLDVFPSFLQAVHYSRPIFIISFLITILAAMGIQTIAENSSKFFNRENIKQLVQAAATIIIFLLVFLDFSPGLTTFPNANFNQPIIIDLYNKTTGPHRAYVTTPYLGYVWSQYSQADFIQYSQEVVNPEYYELILPIIQHVSWTNRTYYLLDIGSEIRFDFIERRFIKSDHAAARAFAPSKAVLVNHYEVNQSEKIFEEIIKMPEYAPTKIGFILPRQKVSENTVDYIIVPNKTTKPNEIEVKDIPSLFTSAPNGTELPWGKDEQGNTNILVDSPGWVFVSQMWYPHWRVNGKPVQETGGGLMAFYADAPGEYKIYWERPWYDYVFWTASIATLLLLVYLYFNPKKHEELLAKIPGN